MPRLLFLALALGAAGCETAPPTTGEPDQPASQEAPGLVPGPDGLELLDPLSETTRPFPFGTDRVIVLAALEAILGPPDDFGTNEECGAGPLRYAVWSGGLGTWFRGNEFVGWELADRPGDDDNVVTGGGLSLGMARPALEDAASPAVEPTTVGTEFAVGGVRGLLDGDGPGATVSRLWAGTTCAAR